MAANGTNGFEPTEMVADGETADKQDELDDDDAGECRLAGVVDIFSLAISPPAPAYWMC